MIRLYFIIFILAIMNGIELYDFNKESNLTPWQVVDDIVMGGESIGSLKLNDDGNAVFKGTISLENYGGFSSIRYSFDAMKIADYSKFIIYLKGDGKRYQFRAKENERDYYSHIYYFETNNDWQRIEIPFNEMYATFRGRKLDMDNFSGKQLEQIGFLIGNKKTENFQLEIDKIEIE